MSNLFVHFPGKESSVALRPDAGGMLVIVGGRPIALFAFPVDRFKRRWIPLRIPPQSTYDGELMIKMDYSDATACVADLVKKMR